jgi:peptidoglycan-N-acetylglucosamine deacetylase
MSKHSARPPKAVLSRRVLLAAGGLVVLGEYLAGEGSAGRHLSASVAPSPAPGATHGPGSTNASGSARASGSASRSASAPASAPSRASSPASPSATRDPAATQAPPATHDATGAPAPQATPSDDPASSHPPGPPGQPMYYVDDGPKVIALTIDDGPSPQYTPQVLQLLQKYGVTATFSMIGVSVAANRALAREVADAGHQIVNHTWTHANLPTLSPGAMASQLTRAQDMIGAATGRRPAMFRAPYGAWSPAVLARCQQLGLAPLDWSVDPRDWARPGVGAIVANIMRNTRSGSIILEHDGGGNRSETVAALSIVLPRLLEAGYRFRTP